MTEHITITGLVGNDPESRTTPAGVPVMHFRLAAKDRYFDRTRNEWVDGGTSWYTVSAFRHLALNALQSVHKGDSLVVSGKLKVRQWTAGERTGTAVDVEAEAIGHNLAWGIASFTRSNVARATDAQPPADAPGEPRDAREGSGGEAWATNAPADANGYPTEDGVERAGEAFPPPTLDS